MSWFVVLEIIYILSAVFCAVSFPMCRAHKATLEECGGTIKSRMTYGDITLGFVIGLVPLINTLTVVLCIGYFCTLVFVRLHNIKVFKG